VDLVAVVRMGRNPQDEGSASISSVSRSGDRSHPPWESLSFHTCWRQSSAGGAQRAVEQSRAQAAGSLPWPLSEAIPGTTRPAGPERSPRTEGVSPHSNRIL